MMAHPLVLVLVVLVLVVVDPVVVDFGKASKSTCVFITQYLSQSCSRGGRGIVEDMCYEGRRAEACVD